jgi:GNAT superfamily N-acetyltransferase
VNWTITTLRQAGDPAAMPQIDAIFFESAATRSFASDAERAAYRDLWLGRYIIHWPETFLIASGPTGEVAGYLAGALFSNREPLPGPDYYDAFPAALLDAFPAHLHINVRQDHRGRTVGATLIEAFHPLCREYGARGFHAVTLAQSRAATFFTRCGLDQRATANRRGRQLVFLGAALGE